MFLLYKAKATAKFKVADRKSEDETNCQKKQQQ